VGIGCVGLVVLGGVGLVVLGGVGLVVLGGVGLVVLGGVGVGVPPPYGGYVVLGGGVDVFGGNIVIEWHNRRIRASKWKQWDIDYRFR